MLFNRPAFKQQQQQLQFRPQTPTVNQQQRQLLFRPQTPPVSQQQQLPVGQNGQHHQVAQKGQQSRQSISGQQPFVAGPTGNILQSSKGLGQ